MGAFNLSLFLSFLPFSCSFSGSSFCFSLPSSSLFSCFLSLCLGNLEGENNGKDNAYTIKQCLTNLCSIDRLHLRQLKNDLNAVLFLLRDRIAFQIQHLHAKTQSCPFTPATAFAPMRYLEIGSCGKRCYGSLVQCIVGQGQFTQRLKFIPLDIINLCDFVVVRVQADN